MPVELIPDGEVLVNHLATLATATQIATLEEKLLESLGKKQNDA